MSGSNRLTLSFIYANRGEQVVAQLAEEADYSYAYVFPKRAVEVLHQYKQGGLKRRNFETAGEFITQVVTPVMDAFFEQACPSAKQQLQIAQWVVNQYLTHKHNGQPIKAEDLYKVRENIEYFDSLKNSQAFKEGGERADLIQYKSYAAFEEMLEPYVKRKREKEAKADILFRMNPEKKKEIFSETTILYEGPEGHVVVPHTPEASKFWGSHTKWCIAGRDYAEKYFPQYNEKSPIIMILPNGHDDDKIALVDRTLYNSADDIIHGLPEPHCSLMKTCLGSFSAGVRESIEQWVPEEILATSARVPAEHGAADLKDVVKKELSKLDCPNLDKQYYGDPDLWSNQDFVIRAVQQGSLSRRDHAIPWLWHASEELKGDREVVLAAIRKDGNALQWASDNMRKDRDIALAAIENNGSAFQYASDDLKKSRDFALVAVRKDGWALGHMASVFRGDREIVTAAVSHDAGSIMYASDELKRDVALSMLAVKNDGMALGSILEEFRGNREFIYAAMQSEGNSYAIGYVPEELRNNKEFVLEALSLYGGLGFLYLSQNLRDDRDVALAALKTYGNGLRIVSPELRNDPEVVLTAVAQDGAALAYADDLIKVDPKFVTKLLEETDDLSFTIRSMADVHYDRGREISPVWQPDDKVLPPLQMKALERMSERGDTEKLQKYARRVRDFWSDPNILFAPDPVAALAKAGAGNQRRLPKGSPDVDSREAPKI